MAKSTKIIAALGVVAGLGVAAMPLASYAADGDMNVTDTIRMSVTPACGFSTDASANSYSNGEGAWTAASATATTVTDNNGTPEDTSDDTTYTEIQNKWTAEALASAGTKTSGAHKMTVVCNNEGGWNVKATVNALEGQSGLDHSIAYAADASATKEGYFVTVTTTDSNVTLTNLDASGIFQNASSEEDKTIIASRGEATITTATFNVTYTVAADANTPAGAYEGNVVYTLAPGE